MLDIAYGPLVSDGFAASAIRAMADAGELFLRSRNTTGAVVFRQAYATRSTSGGE
jgi:hypothetical protein